MQTSTVKNSIRAHELFTALCVLLALCPWGIVLAASPRGFDLTDEAFYLLSTAHPENVTVTFSMFGVVLNPLYDLVAGNIIVLRVVSVLIWLGISAGVALADIGDQHSESRQNGYTFAIQRRSCSRCSVSARSVLYYALWLLTPSYNWLTLVGLTAFWGGFLLWLSSAQRTRRARLGVGIFACVTFTHHLLGKPTSAAVTLLQPCWH